VLGGGECPGLDLAVIGFEGLLDLLVELGVLLDEARREAVEQTQQVVCDQHLPIAIHPAADADGGHLQPFRDQSSELRRDGLQHQAETAGLLQQQGVFVDAFGSLGAAPHRGEAPELVDALRRQPQVTHHRDAGGDDGPDGLQALAPALQLDGVHQAFLQEAPGVAHGFLGVDLVAHEGHIADQEGVFRPARHRPAVVDHVCHGDLQGVLVAQHHHAQRVAHQDGVDTHLVERRGGGVVVRRQHGDGFAALFLLQQRARGYFFTGLRGWSW